MALKNCIECGKICLENPSKLCPDCYAQEEVHEHTVGEYLREHGKSSIEQIHQATGVKEKIIVRMMKSGRIVSTGMIGYPCDMCGKIIYESRLCGACGSGLVKQVQQVNENKDTQRRPDHERGGVRMYSKDEHKK
jgi:rRNA maturation endonuclease Nob1